MLFRILAHVEAVQRNIQLLGQNFAEFRLSYSGRAYEKETSDSLVSVQKVREMFEKAENVQALIPVIPCVDTMMVLQKNEWEDGSVTLTSVAGQSVDRSVLYGAQTPQIFHSEILKDAYNQAFDTAFTDDASVVEKHGKSLSFVIGERLNIKITTAEDLTLAEAVLKVRNS